MSGWDVNATITDSIFEDGFASKGGALTLEGWSAAEIRNGIFLRNEAVHSGGAFALSTQIFNLDCEAQLEFGRVCNGPSPRMLKISNVELAGRDL